jgi:hypothetical protein
MSEPTPNVSVENRVEEAPAKHAWSRPVLTELGDTRSLTESGGVVTPDSPAGQSIS